MCAYILVEGFGDKLPLAVNAGVGALASDLLLLLGDAARGRRRATRVQGTWEKSRPGVVEKFTGYEASRTRRTMSPR